MSHIKHLTNDHIMQTYARFDVTFVRGDGARLLDSDGRDYIDFASGYGVNSVGYAHPKWVEAVSAQAAKLAHTSNLYYSEPAAALAQRLTALSGMNKAFFANSGAEANEGAIKLARKYSNDRYGESRHVIVTLVNSFHGRTMAALSATGQEKFHQHFMPFVDGFVHVPAGDIAAMEALGGNVCAVMAEPVQGEGGVIPLDAAYWQAVRKLCDERDWLFIADEVQTGIGRTGSWFAYQQMRSNNPNNSTKDMQNRSSNVSGGTPAGAAPDIVTFAKGIAGGLPLGGMLANAKCCDVLTPGTHATTFGGNPICCAAALATLDILEQELPMIESKAAILRQALTSLSGNPARGMGLMLGVRVGLQARELVERLLGNGLVTITAGTDMLRLLPPLTIGDDELAEGVARLKAGRKVF